MADNDGFNAPPPPKAPLEILTLLVLDRSGSMNGEEPSRTGLRKFQAVGQDILTPTRNEGFIQRLREGQLRDSMYVGAIFFDDKIEAILDPPVKISDLKEDGLQPEHFTPRGETAIGEALKKAEDIATTWLAGTLSPLTRRMATILLMTDGNNTSGEEPGPIADRIKANARPVETYGNRPSLVLAVAAYGGDANEQVLQHLATPSVGSRSFFRRVNNGEELRDFMISSASAMAR